MFVPVPAAAHELGVGGTADVAVGAGCGPQEFAGADGAADGEAAPNAFPGVDPSLEDWNCAHGS